MKQIIAKDWGDCLRQMSQKDRDALARVLGANHSTPHPLQTVEQYLSTHEVKTERRTSKRGVELIKVHYSSGKVKEYEFARINKTCAFE